MAAKSASKKSTAASKKMLTESPVKPKSSRTGGSKQAATSKSSKVAKKEVIKKTKVAKVSKAVATPSITHESYEQMLCHAIHELSKFGHPVSRPKIAEWVKEHHGGTVNTSALRKAYDKAMEEGYIEKDERHAHSYKLTKKGKDWFNAGMPRHEPEPVSAKAGTKRKAAASTKSKASSSKKATSTKTGAAKKKAKTATSSEKAADEEVAETAEQKAEHEAVTEAEKKKVAKHQADSYYVMICDALENLREPHRGHGVSRQKIREFIEQKHGICYLPAMHRALDQLMEDGLVEKKPSGHSFALTTKGHKFDHKVHAAEKEAATTRAASPKGSPKSGSKKAKSPKS